MSAAVTGIGDGDRACASPAVLALVLVGLAAGKGWVGCADARLVWIGMDDRGIELEIVALDMEEAVVVIHVMPTYLRR
jgi:hypothetical protein